MTMNEAYRYLSEQDRGVSWIANVFLTSGGKHRAANLKALATLVRQGHDVGPQSFTMPYERLIVDGETVTPERMRELAALSHGKNLPEGSHAGCKGCGAGPDEGCECPRPQQVFDDAPTAESIWNGPGWGFGSDR